MMKRLLTIALVLTMAFSFAACGSAPAKGETPTAAPATEAPAKTPAETPGEEPVEITFWHSYSEGEEKIFTETVLTAFAEKYPNIKVNAIRMPYEGMDEQLGHRGQRRRCARRHAHGSHLGIADGEARRS